MKLSAFSVNVERNSADEPVENTFSGMGTQPMEDWEKLIALNCNLLFSSDRITAPETKPHVRRGLHISEIN